jgi:DNA-binding transcriptional MerR regulator
VRFYEEKRLFEPSAHTSGGIRLYSATDANRLIFIRRLVTLGLSLDEIRPFLSTIPAASSRKVRAENTMRLLEMQIEKLAEERAKLDQLERDIYDSIDKVKRCFNCGAAECPEQCPGYGMVL